MLKLTTKLIQTMTVGSTLTLSGLTSCAPFLPPGVGGATFCQVSKPIYWSTNDTRSTKEQVDTHNKKWKALCAGSQ